jgi:capsular polysaccharide export protein
MHILLLQGHSTNFFAYLAAEAVRQGHSITKVNFCAGDDAQWRGARPLRFRGSFEELGAFYDRLFRELTPDAIVLYDALRPVHRPAIECARALGLALWDIENGYFRPDYITMDYYGHGARSCIPRMPEQIRELARRLPALEEPQKLPSGKLSWAVQDTCYRVINGLLRRRYPNQAGIWQLSAREEYPSWIRRVCRDWFRRDRYAHAYRAALGSPGPLFVLPLQLGHDNVVQQCSPFPDMAAVLKEVVSSFARHAPSEARLAIKRHPLDPEFQDWHHLVTKIAGDLRVEKRVLYFAGGNLDALIRAAAGVITVNSTVGLQALEQGKPVKALGRACYSIEGLIDDRELAAFWHDPRPPDPELFAAFRHVAVYLTQVNGGLYSRRAKAHAARKAVARLEMQRQHLGLVLDRRKGRILISYGIVKSGSTLAFELTKRALENAGYIQRLVKGPYLKGGKRRNFINDMSREAVLGLLEDVRDNEFLAFKTHQRLKPDVWELLRRPEIAERVSIHVIFRDPRDAALSLVDAGNRARAKQVGAFAGIADLSQALSAMQKSVETCADWAKLPGSLKLYYDDIAFDTVRTIERIAAHLGISCAAEEVRRYVLDNAPTQMNKGIRKRHVAEMSEAEKLRFEAAFAEFIVQACEQRDYSWFEKQEFSWISGPVRARGRKKGAQAPARAELSLAKTG